VLWRNGVRDFGGIVTVSGAYEIEEAGLGELVDYAVQVGSDIRLVQGAGGNFSMKTGGIVWVKASGTRLADAATSSIFVPLDLKAVRPAVLVSEKLAEHVVAASAPVGLRPSIETAFHVLLPHRYVAHLHPTGSIAAGLDIRIVERFLEASAAYPTIRVPYAKPGIELAREIDRGLPRQMNVSRPMVLLLENHGLVVGAPSVSMLAEVVELVERPLETVEPPVAVEPSRAGTLPGFSVLTQAGSISAAGLAALDHGPLTPDAAVFLGRRPFTSESDAAHTTACVVLADGTVEIRQEMGRDEREIALSMVDVGRLVLAGSQVRALTEAEIRELIDWDAEKWRREMKR
jgi:rhamnose utilization protein RhaD (predicted bifunctional aldolase and dehydrogenase)